MTTTISITFKDTGLGQANVSLIGPAGFSTGYNIFGNDSRDFDLGNGLYQISVTGTSAVAATLNVKAGGQTLVNDTCAPKQIVMNDGFII